MNDFTKQTILITGANGGLGTAVTEAFLAAGATVVGTSKSASAADFPHPNFVAMPSDLTNHASARELAAGVIARFQKIDVVVHVMGGFAGGPPTQDTDDDTWDRMMNLNLRSAFNLLRAVVPPMRQAKSGRIVAIAGRVAEEPQPGLSAYNASKAGLVALVRTVALENRDLGITANSILPGTMITDANLKSNPGADTSGWVPTEDVASLILFLASHAGAQITGAAIPVYGKGA